MPQITFEQRSYPCASDETLLDALLRQGRELPFSCRNGVCHVCMMRATAGTPPVDAQLGLSPRLVEKQYFLPCRCVPSDDLTIDFPRKADLTCLAIVAEKEMLNESICRIALEPAVTLYYHAGQFVSLRRDERNLRSYSLASVPHQDYFLELHVRRHLQGRVSRWLVDDVQIGDEIEISQPQGECYLKASAQAPLLLAGTGTGLAPLLGIARDALYSSHKGDIWLYHGAHDEQDLYGQSRLAELAAEFPNLHYQPCIHTQRSIEQAIRADHANLEHFWVHLAGNPTMVHSCETLALELGAAQDQILTDPYELRQITTTHESAASDDSERHNLHPQETPYPPPTPELWEALEQGAMLGRILDDFYDRVFEDPILSPYFHNSTKQRAKEKVYSFYRRLFSGDRVYFGDRPRNAHHWMVISDRTFDYRENLLKRCMQAQGLSAEMIRKWLQLEAIYRDDIVKDQARGRMVDGSETPAGGYGRETLTIAGVCDGCLTEIDSGTEVFYHLRTGKVFCPACMPDLQHPAEPDEPKG